VKEYRFLFVIVVCLIFISCSDDEGVETGVYTPDPVVYTGNEEMAEITVESAGYLLSRLFNSIDSGQCVGTEKILATELEEIPIFSTEFLTSVIENINSGNTKVTFCDSGFYTIENTTGYDASIVDMSCRINLKWAYVCNYRPRDYRSQNIHVIVNSNTTNHVEASMFFDHLSYDQGYYGSAEENLYLDLTGSILYSNTLSESSREIYTRLNLVGAGSNYGEEFDYQYGSQKMMKFIDFGIIQSIDINSSSSGGSLYFSGSPAMFYDSYHGGVIVETISPLRFSVIPNSTYAYPDVSGEILISGSNSSMTFKVMSERHFKLEIDSDGDSLPDAIRYIKYNDFRPDSPWDYVCNTSGFSCGEYYNLSDFDGDGMHDSWEVSYFTNPKSNDALGDKDFDGLTNYEEYMQGYSPSSAHDPGVE